jgi:hypothetical protein
VEELKKIEHYGKAVRYSLARVKELFAGRRE